MRFYSYPSHIVEEAGQHTDKAMRDVHDGLNEINATLTALQAQVKAIKVPSLNDIQKNLQLGGTNAINITGLIGVTGQAQPAATVGTHATRLTVAAAGQNIGSEFLESDRFYLYTVETVSGSPAWRYTAGISFDLHANRWADLGVADSGALFFELNRQYLYYWNGTAWHWMAGVYQDTLANRPADLGANDQSALFYASDKFTVYEWNGSAWVTVGGALWQATTDSATAAQWLQTAGGGGAVVLNLDTTNKRVGVNNTAPGVDLDVTGTVKASTKFVAPILQPVSDGTTAILIETTGGGVILTVDTTNSRIGIGVTPTKKLDVLGDLKFKAASDNVNWAQFISAGSNVILNIDSVNWRIGINNAAPSFDLDVGGDINTGGVYRAGGTAGVSGTFKSGDAVAKTITVTNGIITAIV